LDLKKNINMKDYYIIISILFLLLILYKKRKNKEKAIEQVIKKEKEKAEWRAEWKRKEKEKEKEDLILEEEFKIICEDGVERIYTQKMYGIIEVEISRKEILFPNKSCDNQLQSNEYNQSLEIEIITWYSEFGKVLVNVEDILDANNKNIECYNEYKNKYLSTIKHNYAMHQPIYIRIINNRCFRYKYGNDSLEPFTGTIDNKNYIDGVLKG